MNVIFYLDSWMRIKKEKPKKALGWVSSNEREEFFLYAENSKAEEVIMNHLEKFYF